MKAYVLSLILFTAAVAYGPRASAMAGTPEDEYARREEAASERKQALEDERERAAVFESNRKFAGNLRQFLLRHPGQVESCATRGEERLSDRACDGDFCIAIEGSTVRRAFLTSSYINFCRVTIGNLACHVSETGSFGDR